MTKLMSIYDEPVKCDKCQWHGTVLDCEPDIDGDGGLGCPNCNSVITVKIEKERQSMTNPDITNKKLRTLLAWRIWQARNVYQSLCKDVPSLYFEWRINRDNKINEARKFAYWVQADGVVEP